ncbi:hypothetical protein [Nocardia cyriacigeorgica]|uniref:hypothetical protein n=1 Tax=Nocardia cyriacigeorgica TaxID=135487 RepID=UPI0024563E09|nr:hypothetical protein [Nocardia cyriacigeorgica]
MSAEDWDDGPASEDWSDRLDIIRLRARRRLGSLLRSLRLRRLADRFDPPLTPWYLRKPLGYHEHFATEEDEHPSAILPGWYHDDVLLAQARYLAERKRAKLIEVATTEPDPELAGAAAAELRRMIVPGQ